MGTVVLFVSLTFHGQIDAVQACLKGIGRIEFAYEGDWELLVEPAWLKKVPTEARRGPPSRYNFSGRMTIDASKPIVLKEHYIPEGEQLSINKISVTPQRSSHISEFRGNRVPTNQRSSVGGYSGTGDAPHPIYTWFPMASLLVANDADAKRITDEGEEIRDGRRCRVLMYRSRANIERKHWIDLERNGLVVASETWIKGVKNGGMKSLDIRRHQSASGRSVWLPMTIQTETYGSTNPKTGEFEPLDGPTQRATTRIVLASLKIDDEQIKTQEVRFNPKFPVIDEAAPKPTAILAKGDAPPQPKQKPVSPEDLQKTVTEADVQKAELQATLRTPPVDWMQRIAWVLIVVGVVGASWMGYQRMQGHA